MVRYGRIIGVAVLVVPFVGAISAAGELSWFVDWPSLVMVVAVVIGGMLLAFPAGLIGGAIRQAVSPFRPAEDEAIAKYAAVLYRAAQLGWAGGLIDMFVGIVLMLQNMDDPSMIGPGMAIGLLGLLYGVVFAELAVQPLRSGMLARSTKPRGDGDAGSAPKSNAPLVTTAAMSAVALFAIMAWAMMR